MATFNLLTGNHGSVSSQEALAPLFNYIKSTIVKCGHKVIVTNNELHKGCINIFLENFPQEYLMRKIIVEIEANHFCVGIVATELIVRQSIPYAKFGVKYTAAPQDHLKEQIIRQRINNFNILAPFVDFIWFFLGRTVEEYLPWNENTYLFPVGADGLPQERLSAAPKIVDVLFFGSRTPHRDRIIKDFTRHGVSVTAVGRGFEKKLRIFG